MLDYVQIHLLLPSSIVELLITEDRTTCSRVSTDREFYDMTKMTKMLEERVFCQKTVHTDGTVHYNQQVGNELAIILGILIIEQHICTLCLVRT